MHIFATLNETQLTHQICCYVDNVKLSLTKILKLRDC